VWSVDPMSLSNESPGSIAPQERKSSVEEGEVYYGAGRKSRDWNPETAGAVLPERFRDLGLDQLQVNQCDELQKDWSIVATEVADLVRDMYRGHIGRLGVLGAVAECGGKCVYGQVRQLTSFTESELRMRVDALERLGIIRVGNNLRRDPRIAADASIEFTVADS
jgi:hypothetical protein